MADAGSGNNPDRQEAATKNKSACINLSGIIIVHVSGLFVFEKQTWCADNTGLKMRIKS